MSSLVGRVLDIHSKGFAFKTHTATSFCGDLVIKLCLWQIASYVCFKKGSCQLPVQVYDIECALVTDNCPS